ncbi:hypothetical protein DRP53_06650 [candidate division WOR-3 bacterium]|uniref:FlgD/Vpr Ig-like domain-containing protein n=1 Tax=candidate division WOR-3 bacterium TaxID=2052148 RepID=A0A660SGJ1_UNCW3|nr:MAG: hypothetical protein DRP53_06650 [candidate division WOR-3 bacterium]
MMKYFFIIIIPLTIGAQVTQEWVVFYNGPMSCEDCGSAIAVGATENVYVAGYSYDINPQFPKALLLKYDSQGNERWVYRMDSFPSEFNDVILDSLENIYVTGYLYDTAAITMKFDSLGHIIWSRCYKPASGRKASGKAIGLDKSGNILVTGGYFSFVTDWDMFTLKYDPDGDEIWVREFNYDSTYGFDDYAFDLVCDGSGSVYVTGTVQGWTIGTCYGTLKYDSLGNLLWCRYYDGHGWGGGGKAQAIDIDGAGNIYITGYHEDTISATNHFDYATIKYDPSGNELWVARYNGTGNSEDRANALVVDEFGNCYVTGYSRGDTTGDDIVTIKYDSEGNTKWIARFSSPHQPGYTLDWPHAITLDNLGNIYVVGEMDVDSTGSTYWDFCTIKYSPTGSKLWVVTFNGANNLSDGGYDIALHGSNIYVTGYSWIAPGDWDCTTIKYSQETGNNSSESEEPTTTLFVAPNPFKNRVTIGWHFKDRNEVSLRIYDATGRLVKEFILPTASTVISWDGRDDSGRKVGCGVYFVRLETGDQKFTRKVLLLR